MNIVGIRLLFENGEDILINNKEFIDFSILNILDSGEEVPYEQTIIKDKLYANLCLIKLNKDVINNYVKERIKIRKDITEIQVIFENNKYLKFDIASNGNPFADEYTNDYEYLYEDDNVLGILFSEYNIKYKSSLFV